MARRGKVIVALSGGVDSSVAAWLLHEQGYECVGVLMRHAHSADAANDVTALADRLGIRVHILDCAPEFERLANYLADEYARARTPNPCVLCNAQLKFGTLLRYADSHDAGFVATGHYARILHRDTQHCLARAAHREKDQSYMLFGIQRADLPRCLFPLGAVADKAEVRRIASAAGLPAHDKPESQEICFIPDNDYRELLRARRPETQRPGQVCDAAGNVLGTHSGIANYTIGQRHGLGIAASQPLYVTRLDARSNTVTLGPREDLLSTGLVAERTNWLTDAPPVGVTRPVNIQIRYQHRATPGTIHVLPSGAVRATFAEPQAAVTPGQAAVFYDDEGIVLGGGWIASGVRVAP